MLPATAVAVPEVHVHPDHGRTHHVVVSRSPVMVRSTRSACCSFVPPHVTDHLARSSGLDTPDPSAAQRTAVLSQQIRRLRETAAPDLPSALTAVLAPRPGKGD